MALPASGQITMGQINVELGLSSTASNMNMNSQAAAHLPSALTQPHGMDEWYNYTHATAPPAPTKVSIVDQGVAMDIACFQSGSPGSWVFEYSYNGSTGWTAGNDSPSNTQPTISVPLELRLCSGAAGNNMYGRIAACSGSNGTGAQSAWAYAGNDPIAFDNPCPFA